MLDWLFGLVANTSAIIIFFSIFLLGVTFNVASLIFGGHGDDGDHDGHDFSGDHDGGAAHGGNGDGDHDHVGEHDGSSVSFSPSAVLSVRGISLLATVFGGVGAIVQAQTGKILFSTTTGLISGYILAALILSALKSLTKQQSNSLIDTNTAVGLNGVVTTSIPAGQLGEVRLVISGVEMVKMAMSENGSEIKYGTVVNVVRVDGGTLIVTPTHKSGHLGAPTPATQNCLTSQNA